MQIRTGTLDDKQAIKAFDCFGGDRPGALQSERCLVAEIDGKVVGYVAFQRKYLIGRDFVEFLVVREGFRRQGVAIALLRAAEAKVSPGRLFISTGADNARMQALLAKDGWTSAGQIDGITHGGGSELFFYRDLPAAE